MTELKESARVTSGWEPGLPEDDTALRQFALAWADTLADTARSAGGNAVVNDYYALCDLARPGGFFNSAVLLQPPATGAWDRTLDDVERRMFVRGSGPVFLWSPWPTPDLTARSWTLAGHPPVLFRPPGGTLPAPVDDLEVREVRSEQELAAWEQVAIDGYPFEGVASGKPGALFAPRVLEGSLRAWVGYVDGTPVAIGASSVQRGLNVLVLGVVLPQHRGRGYWRAMVRTRLAECPDLPSAALFSDLSRPGAQRHGFWPVSRVWLWTRDRP